MNNTTDVIIHYSNSESQIELLTPYATNILNLYETTKAYKLKNLYDFDKKIFYKEELAFDFARYIVKIGGTILIKN